MSGTSLNQEKADQTAVAGQGDQASAAETVVEHPIPHHQRIREHVIPLKNQPALIGYYAAMFGLIPVLGLILGPVGLAYGLIGLERSRHLPRYIGYGHGLFAVVAGTMGLVLNYAAIVGILVYLMGQYMLNLPPFEPHFINVQGREEL